MVYLEVKAKNRHKAQYKGSEDGNLKKEEKHLHRILKHKEFKAFVSVILVFVFLTTSVPSQAFALPILPSENSHGFVTAGPPEKAKPKNVFPKPGKEKIELKSKRTAYSREFLNPDGTFTMEVTSRPMNFKNKRGQWEAIDNQLTPANQPGYDYINKANAFEVFFARNNQSGDLMRFSLDKDRWLSFSPADKFTIAGVPNNSKMEYKNIKPGIDLEYTVDYDRVKEEIVLQKYPGINSLYLR